MRLRGTGYFPGCATGPARRGAAGPGEIAVLGPDGPLPALARAPAAIVLIGAAPLSHRTISLRRLGVPMVLLDPRDAARLGHLPVLRVDGTAGEVTAPRPCPPPPPVPAAGRWLELAGGERVALRASVSAPEDATRAREAGAQAIGLVRSENLAPAAGGPPDQAFYRAVLADLRAAARGLALTVRLPDFAPDKRPAWARDLPVPASPLGLQGARLYHHPRVWALVEALLAAMGDAAGEAERGPPLRVLIPFQSRIEEFRGWRDRVRAVVGGRIDVGAMLEVPAAVLEIDRWLEEAAFVAIGCNDLMQTLYGADRDLAALAPWLDPYAPAALRLLARAAAAAGPGLDRVQLCGVLPQLPGLGAALVGMGFRAFSVDPGVIPHLAAALRRQGRGELPSLARAALAAGDGAALRRVLGVPPGGGWWSAEPG